MAELPELYEALMTTRSMRRFTDEPVSDEVVESILRAAVQAPNGGNSQPYEFVVVTDSAVRARLGAIYHRAWQRYAPAMRALVPVPDDEDLAARVRRNWVVSEDLARHIGDAPVLVLVLMRRDTFELRDREGVLDIGTIHASVYPAVQNIILAARAHGLGTVLTTVCRIYEADVRAACDIPSAYDIAALLPLGHPKGTWGVARRRPAPALTSWNRFGSRRSES